MLSTVCWLPEVIGARGSPLEHAHMALLGNDSPANCLRGGGMLNLGASLWAQPGEIPRLGWLCIGTDG